MPYEVVPLPFKPHRLEGLSDRLLISHYENNYGGAVRRLNAIEERLQALDSAVASTFDLNGLGRERLVAANSMLLHEAYFDSLGGSGEPQSGVGVGVGVALERDFGSVDRWHAEFAALGRALGGGSGWVLLTWSERLGRLTNQWAADHTPTLAAGVPILALDMYEHAYAIDFGAKAAAYVDAFMRNIAWERVETRLGQALHAYAQRDATIAAVPQITVAELRSEMAREADITLVDVCLTEDLARRSDMLPGARFVAPEAIDEWANALPRDKAIVVYCLYGFQVSGETTAALRRRGLQARRLAGGITAWRAMAGPTVPLTQSQS